jgi:hypothetical protein
MLQTQSDVHNCAYLNNPNPRNLFSKRVFATWHSSARLPKSYLLCSRCSFLFMLQTQYRIFQAQYCLSFRSINIRKPLPPVGLPIFLIRHAHWRFSLSVLLTKYSSSNQISKYWARYVACTVERRVAYIVCWGNSLKDTIWKPQA